MTAAAVWAILDRVLTFCIPIPIVVIAAIAGWLWWDRGSAVRQAVDNATVELVAGGQISALKAEVAAARKQKIATEYAYAGFTRRLAVDAKKSGEQNDAPLPKVLADRPWTVRQPDIDWMRQ